MQRWEYNAVFARLNGEDIVAGQAAIVPILGNYGMDGWEIVSVQQITIDGNLAGFLYYFKRPMA